MFLFRDVESIHEKLGVTHQGSVYDAVCEEVSIHDVFHVDKVETNVQTACELRSKDDFARFCLQQRKSGSFYYDRLLTKEAREPALEVRSIEDVIKKGSNACSLVSGSVSDIINWDLRSAQFVRIRDERRRLRGGAVPN